MKRRDFILTVISATSADVELGRTALQKTVFFVGEMVGRRDLGFRAHFYGPFSDLVEEEVSALVMSGLLEEGRHDLGYIGANGYPARRYVYAVAASGNTRVEEIERSYSDLVTAIKKAVADLQAMVSQDLDVKLMSSAAKTYFIAKREGRSLTVDEVRKIGHQLNWSLSDVDVSRVAKLLQKLGLFSSEPS